MNILIVEDDLVLSSNLVKTFEKNIITNRVKTIDSYNLFLNELGIISSYDIVLLDIKLGDSLKNNGIDILKIIRSKEVNIPIVIISGINDLDWLELAFNLGANDYIVKPFRIRELEIRIFKWFKNYLKNIYYSDLEVIDYKGLSYNYSLNKFSFNNKELKLSKQNKYLLLLFLLNTEKLLKTDYLIEKIWGDISFVVDRNLRVNILRLKNSLKKYGIDSWINNIRGEGYILKKY